MPEVWFDDGRHEPPAQRRRLATDQELSAIITEIYRALIKIAVSEATVDERWSQIRALQAEWGVTARPSLDRAVRRGAS